MRTLVLIVLLAACQQAPGVHASDVVLATNQNNLKSGTLQEALDNEIRVDLSKLLPGTRWNITNRSDDDVYKNTTGVLRIEANAPTMVLESGRFAVVGQVHKSEGTFCNPQSDMTYEVLSDSVIYVTSATQTGAIAQVVSAKKDRLVLIGSAGCGSLGAARISILTPAP